MEFLVNLDRELLVFLNGLNSPVMDQIMIWVTNKYAWTPLYLYWGYSLFREFPKQWIMILVSIALLVLVTDQFTSGLMKPFFERLRPCHESSIAATLHFVVNCGGQYGFASGHSANSFAMATFIFILMKSIGRNWWIIFFWAAIVAYSRIYLGLHYPGDVIIGGIIGALFGWLFFTIQNHLTYRIFSRL